MPHLSALNIVHVKEMDKNDEGRVPRTIEIDLTRDLVGCCRAGDIVTVLGIVKVMNAAEAGQPHIQQLLQPQQLRRKYTHSLLHV